MVAEAFLSKEDGKKFVNHKDYDKHNNSVQNLEWCTQKYNVEYSREMMLKPHKTKMPKTTGERYIHYRHEHFELKIKTIGLYKNFRTLEEAIYYRDVVLKKEVAV